MNSVPAESRPLVRLYTAFWRYIGPFVARTNPPSWIMVELVTSNVPPCTTRPELKFTIRPSSCSVRPFNTVNGTVVPKLLRSSTFSVFVAPRIVRLLTVIESGKLVGVEALMATAFQPEFVIITDCELLGKTASDQFDAWSQSLLVGFIQEFTTPEVDDP